MANYKRKLPTLKHTTWGTVLATAEGLKMPVHAWEEREGKKGCWQRWSDLVEICEAIAANKHKEAERDRVIDEWLAVKDVKK